MKHQEDTETRRELMLQAAFARMDPIAMMVSLGSLAALLLWGATALLLWKGAPAGIAVGGHLNLLAFFLPGYSVSWTGSLFGLFWGFLIGAVTGWCIAALWNMTHHLYLMFIVLKHGLSRGTLD